MAIKILEIKQNSEEWLVAREGKVTGSIADSLLTRGLDATLKLNNQRFNGNYFTKRGHILEEEAIEVYEAVHGVTVSRPGMVVNDKYPNAACSPDGVDGNYLLEVKCFAMKKHMEIFTKRDIPLKIMAQLQFNMMICGLRTSKLIMYNPEAENEKAFREIVVTADRETQKNFTFRLANK